MTKEKTSMLKKLLNLLKKNKEIPQVAKDIESWRNYTSGRFSNGVESLQAGTLSSEDLELFIEREPGIFKTLEFLKAKKDAEKKKEVIDTIIKNDEPLITRKITEVEEELKVLQNEQLRLMKAESYSVQQATEKFEALKNLFDRIELTKEILIELKTVEDALRPAKKKRGRPKKEDVVLIEELPQAETENVLIDDEIILLMKKLNQNQKEILLNYINNLITWKDPIKGGGADDVA